MARVNKRGIVMAQAYRKDNWGMQQAPTKTREPSQFKIESSLIGRVGITSTELFEKHGKELFTLSEGYPFFGNDVTWKKYQPNLRRIQPTGTATVIGFSRKPLSETIHKAGKKWFLESKSDWILERLYIPDKFYQEHKHEAGIAIVERGVNLKRLKNGTYTYNISKENDMRWMDIPKKRWIETADYKNLFGDMENLTAYLVLQIDDVRVGIATIGHKEILTENMNEHKCRYCIKLPGESASEYGILIRPKNQQLTEVI